MKKFVFNQLPLKPLLENIIDIKSDLLTTITPNRSQI